MKKNKIETKKMKRKNSNIVAIIIGAKIADELSVLKISIFWGFVMSSYFSFAADVNQDGGLHQEVRAMIENSQALEKEESSDAREIIESSLNAGDQYKSEVNQMLKVSKEAIKDRKYQGSLDWLVGNDLKEEHSGSDKDYRYIFISTSMPKQALKEIFSKATKEEALIVLRGFKNNSYLETQAYFSNLIRETNTGFVIDPELFDTYKINVVPSFVISKAIECEGRKCSTPLHDKISGNISIDYGFDSLSKDGELVVEAKTRVEMKR